MRTIDAGVAAAYLSAEQTPQSRITVRKNRLGFAPLVWNTEVLGGYVDDEGKGLSVWGDACVNGDWLVRLVNAAAWGDSPAFYLSATNTPGTPASWEYVSFPVAASLAPRCRVGLWPHDGTTYHAWYVLDTGSLHVRSFTYDQGAWYLDSATPGFVVGSIPDACAVHPIGPYKAMLVGYDDPLLWVRYVHYNGAFWTKGNKRIVWNAGSLNVVQFSDAEVLDDGTVVLALTLANHGAAYAVRYNPVTDAYSMPTLILGGGPDDLGYRVYVSGLSKYAGRLWAVTWRSVEGSDDHPYAHHVALASSADGLHWRDEPDLVGLHPCRGKLLVSGGKCYVAGNALVYEGDTPRKLGYDNPALRRQYLDTATAWSLSAPGAGSATTLGVQGMADELASPLDPEAEVVLEVGHGDVFSTLFTGILAEPARELAYALHRYELTARGPLYHLAGDGAYQPPVARSYESAEGYHTEFNTDLGTPLLSLRRESGNWATERVRDLGCHVLRGERGIALLPRTVSTQYVTLKTRFKAGTAIQGIFLVFWHEDEKNYWRAGLLNSTTLAIQRVVDGTPVTRVHTSVNAGVNAWYSLYLMAGPGSIRLCFQNTATNDFVPSTADFTYNIQEGEPAIPIPYHVGLEVVEYQGVAGASYSGTVTKAFKKQIQDDSKNWGPDVLGQYVYLPETAEQWRRIVEYRVVVEEDTGDYIALTVDREFGPIPAVGDPYRVYPLDGHPYALFRDFTMVSFGEAWTADLIATNILERAGVSRTNVYSGTLPGVGSAEIHGDLDVLVQATTSPQMVFHASVPDEGRYHGYRLTVGASSITLEQHFDDTYEQVCEIPAMLTLAGVAGHVFRIVVRRNLLLVYCDGHPFAAYTELAGTGRGYCWRTTADTYHLSEFPRLMDSFIWDAEQANSALGRLLQGLRAKLVERADGSVSLSRYDSHDDLGTWFTTVIRQVSRSGPAPTLLTLDGAEYRVHYLEPDGRPIRARRANNPALETEEELVVEARRLARFAREQSNLFQVDLHVPDPRAEIEDKVTVDGKDWIIQQATMTFAHAQFGMEVILRQLLAEPTPGAWGTSKYGESYYG